MSDPDYIYLQPEHCASEDTGRLWCEDDPDDCEDGAEWIQYVRVDLANLQGIHSCHPKCQRPMCKLRREKEELEVWVEALQAQLNELEREREKK